MKKLIALSLAFACVLFLFACGQKPKTAAEWLDLGEKYLLDLDYDQAIAALDHAIEIEPKEPRYHVMKIIVWVMNPDRPDAPPVTPNDVPDMPILPPLPVGVEPDPTTVLPPLIRWLEDHGLLDFVRRLIDVLLDLWPDAQWLMEEQAKMPTQNESGASETASPSSNNESIHIGGSAAIHEDWIYFQNYSDNRSLYRKNRSNEATEKLVSDEISTFCLSQDWIFYVNTSGLYRMRHNGSDRIQLQSKRVMEVNMVDDWVYFADNGQDGSLYRMKQDGSQCEVIASNHYAIWYHIADSRIYYVLNGAFDAIYYCNLDGSGAGSISLRYSQNPVASGGYLFYTSRRGRDNRNTYKYDLASGTETVLFEEIGAPFAVENGWIYICAFSEGFYRARTDGTQLTKICDDYPYPYSLAVSGEWIYYINQNDNYNVYRIKPDGSNRERMT